MIIAPNRWQATISTNDGLVYWCIYASLGLHRKHPSNHIFFILIFIMIIITTIMTVIISFHQKYKLFISFIIKFCMAKIQMVHAISLRKSASG